MSSSSSSLAQALPPEGGSAKYEPGSGNYFPQPPGKRKDKYGKYDVTTPKALLDKEDNFVTVLTVAENRHPNEDEMIEQYARQRVGMKDGTWDPLEDPPIVMRDLLPTLAFVVNKTFTQQEVMAGGGEAVISAYVKELAKHIDFDIVPVMCGQPCIFPVHPLTPMQHRDPIYNQQMQGFYKQHDKSARELLDRVNNAQKEAKQQEENKAIEAAHPVEAKSELDEEDDGEANRTKSGAVPVEKKGGARRPEKK